MAARLRYAEVKAERKFRACSIQQRRIELCYLLTC